MMDVDNCLKAVFSDVKILLAVLCHGVDSESLTGNGPWATIAGRQVMHAGTWDDAIGQEVARMEAHAEERLVCFE